MITYDEIKRRQAAAGVEPGGKCLPLVTLSEFFDGNTVEHSIAPNQWGYGRPPLADIAARLRTVESSPDIAWIRVDLHGDSDEEQVYGEAIMICATATTEDLEARLDAVNWMQSDGCYYEENIHQQSEWHCDVPVIPDGFRIIVLWWD